MATRSSKPSTSRSSSRSSGGRSGGKAALSPAAPTASHNPLKTKLATGKPACGILISMPGVGGVQTLVGAGFDWIFIDMEHGPINIESAHAMIAATRGTQTAPLVRVPWNVHWLIKPVLDAGAMGVIVPMVKTKADAQAAVQAVRYPPTGDRGYGPLYATMHWGLDGVDYADAADRDVTCVLLIEHKDAVKNIRQIVSVPGVDACLIAPFDLSMSYGHRDGPDHQAVQRGIRQAEKAILDAGVTLGGLALTPEAANDLISRGYQLILCGFDILMLQRGAAGMLDNIKR